MLILTKSSGNDYQMLPLQSLQNRADSLTAEKEGGGEVLLTYKKCADSKETDIGKKKKNKLFGIDLSSFTLDAAKKERQREQKRKLIPLHLHCINHFFYIQGLL